MAITTFLVMRHGHREFFKNPAPFQNHVNDLSRLTEHGREQVLTTSMKLKAQNISSILYSPYLRTCETNEIASTVLKCPSYKEDQLYEWIPNLNMIPVFPNDLTAARSLRQAIKIDQNGRVESSFVDFELLSNVRMRYIQTLNLYNDGEKHLVISHRGAITAFLNQKERIDYCSVFEFHLIEDKLIFSKKIV